MSNFNWRTIYFSAVTIVFLAIATKFRVIPLMLAGACWLVLTIALYKNFRVAKVISTVVLWLFVGMVVCSLPTVLIRFKSLTDLVGLIPGIIVFAVIPISLLIRK